MKNNTVFSYVSYDKIYDARLKEDVNRTVNGQIIPRYKVNNLKA